MYLKCQTHTGEYRFPPKWKQTIIRTCELLRRFLKCFLFQSSLKTNFTNKINVAAENFLEYAKIFRKI